MFSLTLIAAALVIVVAGATLARTGERIADVSGLGQVWVGAILVSLATSLPEIATDTAAVLRDRPALAVGDLFGSNMANMAILGLIALLLPAARIFAREAVELTITGSVAIILTALASLFVLAHLRYSLGGAVGFGSLALLVTGAGAVFLLPTFRTALAAGAMPETKEGVTPAALRPWILRFAAAAAAILLAAPLLASSADELVRRTGLDETFVGIVVLALVTSMPELVTSLSAARAGALDLAVSNLFGSNATNMMVLVWLDLVYIRGPLLDRAELSAAAAGLVAIVLMMVGLTAIALRAERRRMPVDATALLFLGGYALGLILVWSLGSRPQ